MAVRKSIQVPNVNHTLPNNGKKIIGTHNGSFHCDEALAVALLTLTTDFENAEVVRTRDEEILKKCDIIVDVGATYEPEKLRFDHHQSSFVGTFNDKYSIKLSSAGLIYKHFGRNIIDRIISSSSNNNVSDLDRENIFNRIYKNFIHHIDGIDNGVDVTPSGVAPNYITSTTLSSRVSRFNPKWNDENPDENEGFKKAVSLTGSEFLDFVYGDVEEWLPARSIVKECIDKRFDIHSSGEVIHLSKMCPWKEHLNEIEKELGISGKLKYVLFQDQRGSWRIQAINLEQSFACRLALPAEWRGLRDSELSTKSNIPNCVFVHASGFIGGNNTYEGVMAMAVKALEIGKTNSN